MKWGSLEAFLAMGGYGVFVWGAYGLTVAAIVLEIVLIARRKRAALAAIERLKRHEASA